MIPAPSRGRETAVIDGLTLGIPDPGLVVLIGPAGCGKSTLAARHFRSTEVISSDACRAMVSDDETDLSATPAAFELLGLLLDKRLEHYRLAVVDATNLRAEHRQLLVQTARRHHLDAVAVVLDVPLELCEKRNRERLRQVPARALEAQWRDLRQSVAGIHSEGFREVHVLCTQEQIEGLRLQRTPLPPWRLEERGPFDIIGDVHGCCDELEELLARLGYRAEQRDGEPVLSPPPGRRAIFLGDLVDRGPRILDTVRLVRRMTCEGWALCLPGNHDDKFCRKLLGHRVKIAHGLDRSVAEVEALPPPVRERWVPRALEFLQSLVSHYVLDEGSLVVAHAGMKESLQGRSSRRVRDFALYGDTTGETDELGLPVRRDWALRYRGRATVVYGHTPVLRARWVNGTINIDTGCVFGGRLTALRYPEMELVSVPARRVHAQPARPLSSARPDSPAMPPEIPVGRRVVQTPGGKRILLREEEARAALETLRRLGVDPRWQIYLPARVPPARSRADLPEHPLEALETLRAQGVRRAVFEELHPGSRGVVVLCREDSEAVDRFGFSEPRPGCAYRLAGPVDVDRLRAAAGPLWGELRTDWLCLECALGIDGGLAPLYVLASEGAVHAGDIAFHLYHTTRLAARDPGYLRPTRYRWVDLYDQRSREEAFCWWQELTASGVPGCVVQPRELRHGSVQPALQCRSPEHLGEAPTPASSPREYSRALRQFAFGLEALERFVAREPLPRVQECLLAQVALQAD
ncbi:MAG: AAA family ATPase [Armatimonadetes bacterium]|nr:AAA family ATPase [Armatimonadota bacterium]